MSKLLDRQCLFASMLGELFEHIGKLGYRFKLGEAYRPPETAEIYARRGIGSMKSLHCLSLAIDLHLFVGDTLLTDSADYEAVGEFWEGLGGSWGGRFKKPDGCHFSLEWEGHV